MYEQEQALKNTHSPPMQMKTNGSFWPEAKKSKRTNSYAGTPIHLSGKLAGRIKESFGISAGELSLRESPEVAKMGARATAQGNVIRFAPGQFRPDTGEGLATLGHELAHIREQAEGGVRANVPGANINFDAGREAAADKTGEAFASGELSSAAPVAVGGGASGGVTQMKLSNPFAALMRGIRGRGGEDKGTKDDRQLNQEIIDKEKYFIPSGLQENIIPKADIYAPAGFKEAADDLTNNMSQEHREMIKETDSTPTTRRAQGVYRGMAADENTIAEKGLSEDFVDLYAQDKYGDLHDETLDVDKGIGSDVVIKIKAKVPPYDYNALNIGRHIKGFKFSLANKLFSKHKPANEDDIGKYRNDRAKRSAILDEAAKKISSWKEVQSAKNSKGKKLKIKRGDLKYFYELGYKKHKLETEHQRVSGTILHKPDALQETGYTDDLQSKIVDLLAQMSNPDCGHTWLEFQTWYGSGSKRAMYTMGFWPLYGLGANPWDVVRGAVYNPDPDETHTADRVQTATISKDKYNDALSAVMNYDEEKYSFMGKNCTTFATHIAKAAGVTVNDSTQRILTKNVNSPSHFAEANKENFTNKSNDDFVKVKSDASFASEESVTLAVINAMKEVKELSTSKIRGWESYSNQSKDSQKFDAVLEAAVNVLIEEIMSNGELASQVKQGEIKLKNRLLDLIPNPPEGASLSDAKSFYSEKDNMMEVMNGIFGVGFEDNQIICEYVANSEPHMRRLQMGFVRALDQLSAEDWKNFTYRDLESGEDDVVSDIVATLIKGDYGEELERYKLRLIGEINRQGESDENAPPLPPKQQKALPPLPQDEDENAPPLPPKRQKALPPLPQDEDESAPPLPPKPAQPPQQVRRALPAPPRQQGRRALPPPPR